jgi:UDP-3-O-[3-hydroxymyristoyl] glucosamine N-acyltransferase
VVFSLGLGVVMARGRRLKKSDGGELEVNKQNAVASHEAILLSNVVVLDEAILLPNVVVLDEAILLPNVAAGDEAIAEPHVAALDATIVEQNIVASNEAIGDRSKLHQINQLVSKMVLYHN